MTQYSYSYEFQKDTLRCMAHDGEFLLGMRKALDAAYFNDPEVALVAETMLRIFDSTHGLPSLGNVIETIEEVAEVGDDVEECQDLAREVYSAGIPQDSAMIRDRIRKFGMQSRLQALLVEGPDFIERGAFAEFAEAARDSITVQADAETAVYDYFQTLELRLQASKNRRDESIPTGIEVIDKHLPDGGVWKGEMALLMGLPGYGKSTTLINIGLGALAAGKKVFHATVGDMSERSVGNRYDSAITGRPIHENRMEPGRTLTDVGAYLDDTGGRDRLIIKFWPSNRITVPGLEQHLRWLEAARGWKPDLLIVDYAANMSPRKDYEGRLLRLAHEEVYKELRALGGVLDVAVWSAIQANRGAFNTDAPGMGEAAEAFGPMRDADIVIGIGMKPEERDSGFIRYRGAKVRDSVAEWSEVTGVDFSRHRIYERDDFDEDNYDADDGPTDSRPLPRVRTVNLGGR